MEATHANHQEIIENPIVAFGSLRSSPIPRGSVLIKNPTAGGPLLLRREHEFRSELSSQDSQ